MLTLGTIRTQFTNFLANQGVSNLVGDWVYWSLCDLFKTEHKFWWNKRRTSFATVDGTAEYFLSSDVWGKDILWMGDESVQGKVIVEKDLEDIYAYDSTPTEEGEPFCWALVNQAHVQSSNTATTSSAVSSSDSDMSIQVTIRGRVSGNERVEQIQLNGTTAATPSSALNWDADSIYSVTLASVCTGVVTVTVGNNISVIPPGELRVECLRIRLHYVPGEVLTIPYIYYKRPRRLVNDGDIVDIPDFAIPCLLKKIEYWGHINNGDIDFAQMANDEYKREKMELISASRQELTRSTKKYWNESIGSPKFFLPRTINAEVTE